MNPFIRLGVAALLAGTAAVLLWVFLSPGTDLNTPSEPVAPVVAPEPAEARPDPEVVAKEVQEILQKSQDVAQGREGNQREK